MAGARCAPGRVMAWYPPPLVPSPHRSCGLCASPGAPRARQKQQKCEWLEVFVAKRHVSAHVSQHLGITTLISWLLRQPEGEVSDASISFSPLLPIGLGDVCRRCHRVLATAQACHHCHCRHLGRLHQIHRVRRSGSLCWDWGQGCYSTNLGSPQCLPSDVGSKSTDADTFRPLSAHSGWHVSLWEGFLLPSAAEWPGTALCSSFWSLNHLTRYSGLSQYL